MSKVKVLYVIDNFHNPNAGTENQLFRLISQLDRNEFEPHLLVFKESYYLRTEKFPCEYTVLGATSIKSPKTWLKLVIMTSRLKRDGVRLAHIFFNDPSIICPPIFSMFGIKSIISRRDMGYWYTSFYLSLLTKTKAFVDAVTTNSEAVKTITAEKEKIAPEKIHVIYNGYDLDDQGIVHQENQTLKELKNNGAILVFLVANIRPIKRIQDAIKAIAEVNKYNKDLHFVQVGDGDPSSLNQLATQLGVKGNCHFIGPQTNVKGLLPLADIGLLCSESEGFSNAIVEYQLASLPVVCSKVGGNPEAVEHQQTGYLYECGDVMQLAEHLLELTNDEVIRRRLGGNARANALARYDIKAVATQNETLYKRLLERI